MRVPLHGRRVRGWVVAVDVEPEATGEIRALLGVVSAGPDAPTVELAEWIARRWVGPLTAVLRSASPPNRVPARPAPAAPAPVEPPAPVDAVVADLARRASELSAAVVRCPPLLDRRELVAALVAPHGSTVVVTADGHRANGLVAWLGRRGVDAVLDHSDASAAARTATWSRAAAGSCVVVGGRVAALAPVPDLAAAIVVDDADEALQEERSPTWHARDVLWERARRAGAQAVLVSPAPSVVGLELGELVAPPHAHEAHGWPHVLVVDRRDAPPGAGLFPDEVATALRAAVDAGGPAVCVVNRRGRVRLLACGECGTLVRHDPQGAPVWQPDGHPDGRPRVCPACGSGRLRVVRVGVGRLAEELRALLPRAVVADVDADSARVPDDAVVVVGTEAVLHRPEVVRRRPRLVAFLDFDQELQAPRVRSAEQALWLLVRGARLLWGRPRSETHLLVQTRDPGHEVVAAAQRGDPSLVAEAERARRRALGLPPFGALAELRGAPDAVAAALEGLGDLTVLGPREEGVGLAALVRAPAADVLATALAAVVPAARTLGRLRVVVDPPRA